MADPTILDPPTNGTEVSLGEEDACANSITGDYDLGLHIGAVFILLFISLLGMLIPFFTAKMKSSSLSKLLFSSAKMFGTGVILATAIIHMLIPAVLFLSNPCLPTFWTEEYPAFAAIFFLFAILSTHSLQVALTSRSDRLSHKKIQASETVNINAECEVAAEDMEKNNKGGHTSNVMSKSDDHSHHEHFILLRERQLAAYLLEIGIFSHSILIGITLGVARSEFVSLLIALSFHQFFEGIALSAVLIEAKVRQNRFQFANFFYCLTTPIGICIGIGIRSLYNDNGVTSLLTQGILDALSGGILIYDALINIIAPHFGSMEFKSISTPHQFLHLGALWLGTALMAIIGKYA